MFVSGSWSRVFGVSPTTIRCATRENLFQSGDIFPSASSSRTFGSSAANRAISRVKNVFPRRGWAPTSTDRNTSMIVTTLSRSSLPSRMGRQMLRGLQSSRSVTPAGMASGSRSATNSRCRRLDVLSAVRNTWLTWTSRPDASFSFALTTSENGTPNGTSTATCEPVSRWSRCMVLANVTCWCGLSGCPSPAE
jgi:hypothetical protein